jgi:tetratricopeptide (TPR) repeat protein
MLDSSRSKSVAIYALCLLAMTLSCAPVKAQNGDETDPVKLFEKGQDAHAKGDLKRAIELYDAAIKLNPEFPEAEFQRAMALLLTNRKSDAIAGFNRAVTQRPDWGLAYAKFGSQLAFAGDADQEAEPLLRKAIQLDARNLEVIVALAVLRQRARDLNEAVKLMRAATDLPDATFQTWRRRAYIENSAGDLTAALASITHAIEMKPAEANALRLDRARFRLQANDRAGALEDLAAVKTIINSASHVSVVLDIAQLFARAGDAAESLRLLDALGAEDRKRPEVIALRAELAGDAGATVEQRAALEELLKKNPTDATLLARLGGAYRRVDPIKSQGFYYRALQIDPQNPAYATGYAAALVQDRKFAEAEPILKRVLAALPDDYTSHANLALALYEMKRFAEALPEYEWLSSTKPEIAATYFFIATAHDNLGEYKEALDAYGKFLSHADPGNNKLEIDKVNLRLPVLRAQIKRGEGVKQKRPQ